MREPILPDDVELVEDADAEVSAPVAEPTDDRTITPPNGNPITLPDVKPRPRQRTLDQQFIDDMGKAIRAGVRVQTAAEWLGVSKKRFQMWRVRTDGLYGDLRIAIA